MKFLRLLPVCCFPLATFLVVMHPAPTAGAAFVVVSPASASASATAKSTLLLRTPAATATTALRMSLHHAEEQLEGVRRKWEDLKAEESRLLLQHGGGKEAEAADFAEKVVEAAIEYTRAMEEVKEEQVQMVHAALSRAIDMEAALERTLQIVHQDTSVVAAHDVVEGYLEDRIHRVQEDEMHLKDEERIRKDEVAGLKFSEAALKHFLGDLKHLKHRGEPNLGA